MSLLGPRLWGSVGLCLELRVREWADWGSNRSGREGVSSPSRTWPQLGGSGGGPEGGSPPVAWPELQGPQAASSGGWRGGREPDIRINRRENMVIVQLSDFQN